MKAHTKVEFPCGYKVEIEFNFGPFDMGSWDVEDKVPKECPLHGKNCPPTIKKK